MRQPRSVGALSRGHERKPSETLDLQTVISEGAYDGMQTFDQSLYAHVTTGRVSIDDAFAAASSPHDFKVMLDSEGRRATSMLDVPTHA